MNTQSPLLTDQYQLVMAQAYWHNHLAEQEAVFHLYFRKHPFDGNYTIACGLADVIDYIQNWRFEQSDIDYLSQVLAPDNSKLFKAEFLDYLSKLRFTCNIDAVPEGTLVFPNEPLLRIQGPILQCQLLETPLINLVNFATLVATKAARVCQAAYPDEVIEFGLRRAQGPDAGMIASRAAFIAGCSGTSNVLAGKYYGIPVKGTLAHSWIMAAANELTAFEHFVQAMPNNAILLVDTYNTEQGVKNAITIGKELRKQGHDLLAIRLDSGDLSSLSKKARKLLDDADFMQTKILASGDLDEYRITEIKADGAKVDIWGVGTRLVTAYDQPSLDVIYKLAAIKSPKGLWEYKVKVSDSPEKTTSPGIHQVRRFYQDHRMIGDVIYDVRLELTSDPFAHSTSYQDLLVPIFNKGKLIYSTPSLLDTKKYCHTQLSKYLPTTHAYSVALEKHLQQLKDDLIG